jgi:hypothetical protein
VLGAELSQEFQSAPASRLHLLRIGWRLRTRWGGAWGFGSVEAHPADIEVLFEAIQLEEIRELEGADVSTSLTDLALEIADDPLEIGLVEAGLEKFIPEPFAVKAQAHALAGQPAVQRVSLLNALDHEL